MQLISNLLIDTANDMEFFLGEANTLEALQTEISEVQPHMVLLEESSQFSGESFLVHLLLANPNLPVVVICQDVNLIHVVHRETRHVTSPLDLIQTINLI